jgi:thiosulfate dehydrogenase [quinone] large subunit
VKRSPTAPLWPLAVARIMIGLLWLYSLRWKLPPDFDGGSQRGLREWLELEVEFAAFEPYASLISDVVLPNFTFFAWMLFFAELLVGLSLLTGTFTRLGAAIGLLMSLNLAVGLLDVPNEWPWSYVMLAMWHAVFVVVGAGQLWGADAWLIKHGRLDRLRFLSMPAERVSS